MKCAFALLAMALVAGCKSMPKDPFRAAEVALHRNDLLRALQAYDAVPVSHARYPDARAAAVDVELRIRRCHEWMLEALILRGEWRDRQALQAFRRASELWPSQPNLSKWIAATERRLKLFAERQVEHGPEFAPAMPVIEIGEVAQVAPVPQDPAPPMPVADDPALRRERELEVDVADVPAAGDPETAIDPAETPARVAIEPVVPVEHLLVEPAELPESQPEPLVPTSTSSPVGRSTQDHATVADPRDRSKAAVAEPKETVSRQAGAQQPALPPRLVAEDPVALGLVAVEAKLRRGELAAAVRDLTELRRRYPKDKRVARRLARLLQQRALVHYGRGELAAAITDWQQLLELDPGNGRAKKALQQARQELAGRSRR